MLKFIKYMQKYTNPLPSKKNPKTQTNKQRKKPEKNINKNKTKPKKKTTPENQQYNTVYTVLGRIFSNIFVFFNYISVSGFGLQ